MAVVVKLAERAAVQHAREKNPARRVGLRSAEIVILPCIRRERFSHERLQAEPAAARG